MESISKAVVSIIIHLNLWKETKKVNNFFTVLQTENQTENDQKKKKKKYAI